MDNPLVSVAINTLNEEKNIENCLKSLFAQSYKNFEIIIVDNFSQDKTKELALKYTPNVFEKGPERSVQKNFGILEKARGEYVMHIDADMILSPNLIERCVAFMGAENCAALHIKEVVLGRKFWSQVRRFERSFYDGTVIDGARFFKRNVLVAVGGFDEKFYSCEDWDVDKKIKQSNNTIKLLATIHCNQESITRWGLYGFIKERGVNPEEYSCAIYHNEVEFNFKKYLTKKSYYATGFEQYINKWGKDDPDIKKQFSPVYRYFGVFCENGKWKQAISHPILMIGVFILRFFVGLTYIMRSKRNVAIL